MSEDTPTQNTPPEGGDDSKRDARRDSSKPDKEAPDAARRKKRTHDETVREGANDGSDDEEGVTVFQLVISAPPNHASTCAACRAARDQPPAGPGNTPPPGPPKTFPGMTPELVRQLLEQVPHIFNQYASAPVSQAQQFPPQQPQPQQPQPQQPQPQQPQPQRLQFKQPQQPQFPRPSPQPQSQPQLPPQLPIPSTAQQMHQIQQMQLHQMSQMEQALAQAQNQPQPVPLFAPKFGLKVEGGGMTPKIEEFFATAFGPVPSGDDGAVVRVSVWAQDKPVPIIMVPVRKTGDGVLELPVTDTIQVPGGTVKVTIRTVFQPHKDAAKSSPVPKPVPEDKDKPQ